MRRLTPEELGLLKRFWVSPWSTPVEQTPRLKKEEGPDMWGYSVETPQGKYFVGYIKLDGIWYPVGSKAEREALGIYSPSFSKKTASDGALLRWHSRSPKKAESL